MNGFFKKKSWIKNVFKRVLYGTYLKIIIKNKTLQNIVST